MHISELHKVEPPIGQRVEFQVSEGRDGRTAATNVVLIEDSDMGDLVNLDVAVMGARGEPSPRAALLRVKSALAATDGEIERVLVGKEKLAAEMGAGADVEQDFRAKVSGEAASLVEMMKRGVDWTLGQFGSRATRKTAELLSVSALHSAIGDAALAEAAEELQRLEAKRERLHVAQVAVIRETIREAIQDPLLVEYGGLLEQLQEILPRLKGVERFLTPQSHDYRPDASRIALTVPNFARGDGSDQAVVVEPREIAKVEAHLHAFAGALERDPMAPRPELPPLDASADPSTTYDQLTAPERAAVDRDFIAVTNHRKTVDSNFSPNSCARPRPTSPSQTRGHRK